MLPELLVDAIIRALQESGDCSPIRRIKPVHARQVNTSVRLVTARASYFLKWRMPSANHGLFGDEARGLELIRQTQTVRVPAVLAMVEPTETMPGFMLQEWIEPGAPSDFKRRVGSRLGSVVAAMHKASAAAGAGGYGWGAHTSGSASRPWDGDWIECFRDHLLWPRVESAVARGWMTPEQRRGMERLMERLDEWLGGVERQPTLLHGDLHGGNVLCNRAGEPVLVDPSWFYGDREYEFAATYIAGRFPPAFYIAYESVWPLPAGSADRRDLYTLPLLLARDDPRYRNRIDPIVRWYTGLT